MPSTASPFEVLVQLKTARAIKADSPTTSVVMITGWANMMKDNGEHAPEVDAVLPKPPNIQNLQNLLLRLGSGKPSVKAVAESVKAVAA